MSGGVASRGRTEEGEREPRGKTHLIDRPTRECIYDLTAWDDAHLWIGRANARLGQKCPLSNLEGVDTVGDRLDTFWKLVVKSSGELL